MRNSRSLRALVVFLVIAAALFGGAASRLLALCGPFTDSDGPFCPFILEMYYLGITAGTSPTTFSPEATVTLGQMSVFISTGIDQTLSRGSRRAALDQWWTTTPHYDGFGGLALTGVGVTPKFIKSDGTDVWVSNFGGGGTVARVRASDGKLLEFWTGATNANGVLIAMGRVFVVGTTLPGKVYMIDPKMPAGAVTTVASNLGNSPAGIAFDGSRIWTDLSAIGNLPTPGASNPFGVCSDGVNFWISFSGSNAIGRF